MQTHDNLYKLRMTLSPTSNNHTYLDDILFIYFHQIRKRA